jgi:hypothetical protein
LQDLPSILQVVYFYPRLAAASQTFEIPWLLYLVVCPHTSLTRHTQIIKYGIHASMIATTNFVF